MPDTIEPTPHLVIRVPNVRAGELLDSFGAGRQLGWRALHYALLTLLCDKSSRGVAGNAHEVFGA